MNAADAIAKIIRKSRVHFYKPIQIAEILHKNRTEKWPINDLQDYRNISKRWRDEVSQLLVGRVSTSSQKFQDNLFEANAMPHEALVKLAQMNRDGNGFVEAYVYRQLEHKLRSVHLIHDYITKRTPSTFRLPDLLGLLTKSPGLKRSIDKAYEITVYALFSTIVRALKVNVTVAIQNPEPELLRDFEAFLRAVLGLTPERTSITFKANLYRGGVTNAADRGLDMISNFGPAVQVKHLSLTEELADDIVEGIAAHKIVIVCKDADQSTISRIFKQLGMAERIQGIVTLSDLNRWYSLCMGEKYAEELGKNLIKDLEREFSSEFPTCEHIGPFIAKRRYDKIPLPAGWRIEDI